MNIKREIGQRIQKARKDKGLTCKALAELTGDIKQSRIHNWESGHRTPSPESIKQLAEALDVSPAYLLCLTDDVNYDKPKKIPGLSTVVPILDHLQACDATSYIQSLKIKNCFEKISFLPISYELFNQVGQYTYALQVKDESMEPELLVGDTLIIDPDILPTPGDLVVVQYKENNEAIIRRYKQLSMDKEFKEFALLATNENWPTININHQNDCRLHGTIVGLIRKIKKNG